MKFKIGDIVEIEDLQTSGYAAGLGKFIGLKGIIIECDNNLAYESIAVSFEYNSRTFCEAFFPSELKLIKTRDNPFIARNATNEPDEV